MNFVATDFVYQAASLFINIQKTGGSHNWEYGYRVFARNFRKLFKNVVS
jgi:hypothetical protein